MRVVVFGRIRVVVEGAGIGMEIRRLISRTVVGSCVRYFPTSTDYKKQGKDRWQPVFSVRRLEILLKATFTYLTSHRDEPDIIPSPITHDTSHLTPPSHPPLLPLPSPSGPQAVSALQSQSLSHLYFDCLHQGSRIGVYPTPPPPCPIPLL